MFLVCCLGPRTFVKREFWTYMTLGSEYMLMDYDESRLGFYLDYLSFVILAVFLVRLAAALGRLKAGPGAGGGEADKENGQAGGGGEAAGMGTDG